MAKKLIIIDDSSTSLNFLKTLFAKNSWEVYGINNADKAIDLIYDVAPDLIITDAIMPRIGGFQFLKTVRSDEKISKIPIIIYSVLPEANAKFYIKEQFGEYFMNKNSDPDDILNLAEAVIQKHPLDKDYKENILMSGLFIKTTPPRQKKTEAAVTEIQKEPEKETVINKDELEYQFKEKYNFSYSDEKIFSEIFPLLFKILDYNLCVVSVDYFERNEKTIFCDIRNIILSPIFQKFLIEKFKASDIVLYKKYSPKLKMMINEDEFFSKIEFNFNYKNENIANVIFYSQEKSKWQIEENKEILEEILFRFFKARYINKKISKNKKDNPAIKYFTNKLDLGIFNKAENTIPKEDMYTCIIEIANYNELKGIFNQEDLDIINSRISEKIIECLEEEEQVYKNSEDEYIAIIYAKDSKHALHKLSSIINIISKIKYENTDIHIIAGASNCIINGEYNIYEAQKNAREALENTDNTEKVIIK